MRGLNPVPRRPRCRGCVRRQNAPFTTPSTAAPAQNTVVYTATKKIRVKNSATAFYLQWVHSSANRTVRARGRSRRQIADERSASISQMRPEIIHTLSTGSCGSPNAKISVRETTFSTPPLSFSTTHERNLFVKNGGPNEKNLWSGGEQLFRGRTLFPITP